MALKTKQLHLMQKGENKMKKFKKVLFGLTAVTALTLITACGSGEGTEEGTASELSGSTEDPIKFWTSSSSLEERAMDYADANELDLEVTFIANDDISTKLRQSVQDPSTTPDVFAVSRDFSAEWIENSNAIVNLSETFPEEMEYYTENAYPTFVNVGSDDNGDVYGVTAEFPVGMMFYNRDVAQEVFGTDDYQEVASQLDSWDKVIEVNEQLPDDIKMFGTLVNVTNALVGSRQEPWVVDEEFVIDEWIENYMELVKTFYEEDMLLSEEENDVYFSGYQTGSFFLDHLPTWGYRSKAKPQLEQDTTEANWGVTYPTESYIRGGTYYFVSEAANNKVGAMELIEGMALNEEALVDYNYEYLDLSSLQPVNEVLFDSGVTSEELNGQEIFQVYGEQADIVNEEFGDAAPNTRYDFSIGAFVRNASVSYATNNMTKEEAVENIISETSNAYPELTITNELQ
jgi:maltose-binding protein MalE